METQINGIAASDGVGIAPAYLLLAKLSLILGQ